jgi:hypothetical protein
MSAGQFDSAGWGEPSRGAHPDGGIRPIAVVLVSPVSDKDLGFEKGAGLLDGEQLVVYVGAVGPDFGHDLALISPAGR